MCNAFNHDKSCRCGFGGPDHLGGGGGGSEKLRGDIRLEAGRVFSYSNALSYLYPNAKCPNCQAPVYFLKLSNGGRVFFDEIGPPWPKHPCTDYNYLKTSDNDLYLKIMIIDESKHKKKLIDFKWSIGYIKRIIEERILLRIETIEPRLESNVWIKYNEEIKKIYKTDNLILLIERNGKKIKLFWFDLKESISKEIECEVINNVYQ
jgi:hypothetical protein